MAAAADIRKQAVSNWFAGRQEPTAEQVLAIQEFMANKERE